MLNVGNFIDCGDFIYQIQGEVKSNKKLSGYSHRVYFAKAKKVYKNVSAPEEERFIKFVSEKATYLIDIMETENKFRMYYPYIASVLSMEKGKTEEEENVHILEMEYQGEKTLYDAIEEKTILEKEKFSYMLQLLYAAEYYSKGKEGMQFIHRDIKPQNVMICQRGGRKYAVLIDFDLAHIPGSTRTIRMMQYCKEQGEKYYLGGTKGYIDPRAWGPCQMDIGLDIYSMGRTFCYCLLSDEWRNKQEEPGYFTEKENYEIKDYFSNHRNVNEENIEDPDWKSLAYGLDKDRLDIRYQEMRYEELLNIIQKMVAPLNKRYTDFGIIIDHFESFLKGLYGEEEFDSMLVPQLVLEEENIERTENTRYLRCIYPNGDGEYSKTGKYNGVRLNDSEVLDIKLAKKLVATVYNQKGQLYYMSYIDDKKKRVETGDAIFYNGYSVQFELKGDEAHGKK